MSLEDMPSPGTPEWDRWFQAQDPDTQQAVMWTFGYDNANTLPSTASAGGFAPQLDPSSYDLSSMFNAPLDFNSKGKVLPFGLDQAAQTTNVIQDRNSLLPDNVIAALSGQGAYDPSAFQQIYEPIGNPLQNTGARTLEAYAQDPGGGWQSFIANQLVNGASPSSAIAALKAFVMAPASDSATPEAQAARAALLNSLPTRYAQPDVTGAMPKMDYSTPTGFATSFDEKALNDMTNSMFEKLMSDPTPGYVDPDTGLQYAGAKAVKTPEMEWYDKYGLPYPTASYSDPTRVKQFQDSVSPVSEDDINAWVQKSMDADAAKTSAFSNFQQAQQGLGQQMQQPAISAGGRPGPGGVTQFGFDDSPKLPEPLGMNTAGDLTKWLQEAGLGQAQAQGPTGQQPGSPWMTLPSQQSSGPGLSSQALQAAMAQADQRAQQKQGPLGASTGFTGGRAGAVSRQSNAAGDAIQRYAQADKANRSAIDNARTAGEMPESVMQRVLAAMQMKRLADNGRTPLNDALNQRMLTIRNQGVLGY